MPTQKSVGWGSHMYLWNTSGANKLLAAASTSPPSPTLRSSEAPVVIVEVNRDLNQADVQKIAGSMLDYIYWDIESEFKPVFITTLPTNPPIVNSMYSNPGH